MGPEPRVDARDMKRMAALRQQPEPLPHLEFVQTHGAIRTVDQPWFKIERRYRVDQRLGQTVGTDIPDVVVKEATGGLVPVLPDRRRSLDVSPTEIPAAGEHETGDEQDDDAEHAENDDEDCWRGLGLMKRRRRRRRRRREEAIDGIALVAHVKTRTKGSSPVGRKEFHEDEVSGHRR